MPEEGPSVVRLTIPRPHAGFLRAMLAELPIESAFVILTSAVLNSDGFLVWKPQTPPLRSEAVLLKQGESGNKAISGSFVAFLADQPHDDVIVFEDVCNTKQNRELTCLLILSIFQGFFCRLTESRWRGLRASLSRGEKCELPARLGSTPTNLPTTFEVRRSELSVDTVSCAIEFV